MWLCSRKWYHIFKILTNFIDFDPNKCEYCLHNAKIYAIDNKMQILNKDFRELKLDDIQYP